MSVVTESEIAQEFLRGRNCAQCVFTAAAEEIGFDPEESDRIAACFGGGMGMGQTCGAVTGALMAIGLMGGGKEEAAEFCAAFSATHGSCQCRELIGFDLSDGEQAKAARGTGILLERCPTLVESACRIAADIMER